MDFSNYVGLIGDRFLDYAAESPVSSVGWGLAALFLLHWFVRHRRRRPSQEVAEPVEITSEMGKLVLAELNRLNTDEHLAHDNSNEEEDDGIVCVSSKDETPASCEWKYSFFADAEGNCNYGKEDVTDLIPGPERAAIGALVVGRQAWLAAAQDAREKRERAQRAIRGASTMGVELCETAISVNDVREFQAIKTHPGMEKVGACKATLGAALWIPPDTKETTPSVPPATMPYVSINDQPFTFINTTWEVTYPKAPAALKSHYGRLIWERLQVVTAEHYESVGEPGNFYGINSKARVPASVDARNLNYREFVVTITGSYWYGGLSVAQEVYPEDKAILVPVIKAAIDRVSRANNNPAKK